MTPRATLTSPYPGPAPPPSIARPGRRPSPPILCSRRPELGKACEASPPAGRTMPSATPPWRNGRVGWRNPKGHAMIEVRGIRKTFPGATGLLGRERGTGNGEVAALQGTDLSIAQGEFFCLLGPSG